MQTKAKLKKNMNPPVSSILLRKMEALLLCVCVCVRAIIMMGGNGILNRPWTVLEN
jgi:hypothetical protein